MAEAGAECVVGGGRGRRAPRSQELAQPSIAPGQSSGSEEREVARCTARSYELFERWNLREKQGKDLQCRLGEAVVGGIGGGRR